MRVWRNHPRSKKTVPQNAMTAFLWGTSSRAGDVRWRHRCDLASHRILLHPIASPRCPDDRHPGPAAGREGLCAAPPNQASSQNVIFALARSKAKPSSHPKIRCPAFFLVLAALCHEASIRGHLSGCLVRCLSRIFGVTILRERSPRRPFATIRNHTPRGGNVHSPPWLHDACLSRLPFAPVICEASFPHQAPQRFQDLTDAWPRQDPLHAPCPLCKLCAHCALCALCQLCALCSAA